MQEENFEIKIVMSILFFVTLHFGYFNVSRNTSFVKTLETTKGI